MINEISPADKKYIISLATYYPHSCTDLLKTFVLVPKAQRCTRLLRMAAGLSVIEIRDIGAVYCELITEHKVSQLIVLSGDKK